jgi:ATP-binding cassette subfamily B (MDR/TAP) protein 1
LQSIGGVVFGFTIAFIWGWKLTLILMAFIPLIVIIATIIGKLFVAGVSENLKAYAQSAGYAEQALSAIRVV